MDSEETKTSKETCGCMCQCFPFVPYFFQIWCCQPRPEHHNSVCFIGPKNGTAAMPVPQAVPQQAPPQAAVFVQGQEPLTASMLAQAPPSEQKQMLGERLFPLIQGLYPDLAGKITGMLLEIDNSELVHMLEHPESLKSKVEEAVAVLQAHKPE